jgi:hypothetical protein
MGSDNFKTKIIFIKRRKMAKRIVIKHAGGVFDVGYVNALTLQLNMNKEFCYFKDEACTRQACLIINDVAFVIYEPTEEEFNIFSGMFNADLRAKKELLMDYNNGRDINREYPVNDQSEKPEMENQEVPEQVDPIQIE